MRIEEVPLKEPIQNDLGITPVWQSWLSSLSDYVEGEYEKGEIKVEADYEPTKANISLMGSQCALNMVWGRDYPNAEFTLKIPRNDSKPFAFVESIILVYAETSENTKTYYAKVEGENITMPAIENAVEVIVNTNLILERI